MPKFFNNILIFIDSSNSKKDQGDNEQHEDD